MKAEKFIESTDFTEEEFKAKLAALNNLPVVGFKDDVLTFPRSHRIWAGLYDNDDYRCYCGLMIDGKLYRGSWWEKKGDFKLEVRV